MYLSGSINRTTTFFTEILFGKADSLLELKKKHLKLSQIASHRNKNCGKI